jgi:hypothetical protein
MSTDGAAASDQRAVAAWRREYRLSREILLAGVVVFTVDLTVGLWATSSGIYPASFWAGLLINVVGSAGFALMFAGAVFASHNWSLLRHSQRLA